MKSRLVIENWVNIITMLLLTVIGIICMWSIIPSSAEMFESHQPITSSVIIRLLAFQPAKQTLFAILSLLVFMLVLKINYYKLKDYSWFMYLSVLILLVALLGLGRFVQGSRRWFSLGPVAFQPSEFMKIATVFVVAQIIMHKQNLNRLSGLIIPFILTVIPMGLILLQPDLGTSLLFMPALFVMLFVGGARLKYLVIAIVLIVLSFPVAYMWGLKDYQKSRIKVFIDPSKSPSSDGYQLLSSRTAVGAGGFMGRAWGGNENTTSVFVPERHNDFVFTIIAEEWGFVGASLVVVLYLILLLSALLIAATTREPFGRLTIAGLTTILAIQIFINIGMTIGLAPVTGMTLPFISYGGSSLMSSFIIMAIINNIRMHQLPSFAYRDFE
ncbi:MAG: rod shape-determining protein RodA [Candidatus Brocadiia bacterium]